MRGKVNINNRNELLLEIHPINPPFAYAAIVRELETGKLKYIVIEPILSETDIEAIEKIKKYVLEDRKIDLKVIKNEELFISYLKSLVEKLIKKKKIKIDEESIDKILYYLLRDLLYYSKIDVMMRDTEIEDISCDGTNTPIYVWHRRYESLPTNVMFTSSTELNSFIVRLAYKAGKQISIATPIVEGTLPEGYRVHLTHAEVSRRGSTFTIRKFRKDPYTIVDLINFGTISSEAAAFMWLMMDLKKSTMIGGATAAGKTTLLNALAMLIKPEAKIISIEEVAEIRLPHENWVPLIARPAVEKWVQNVTLFELLKSALRMRPDYIIVGEIRGKEAYTFFQSIATGHTGMCTIHAENVEYAIRRLESKPMNIPRLLIPMMNLYVQIERIVRGGQIIRRVTSVHEILGIDLNTGELISNEVFSWNPIIDKLERKNKSVILERVAQEKLQEETDFLLEVDRRRKVLEYLCKKNLSRFEDVSKVIRNYYYDPERFLMRIEVIP